MSRLTAAIAVDLFLRALVAGADTSRHIGHICDLYSRTRNEFYADVLGAMLDMQARHKSTP